MAVRFLLALACTTFSALTWAQEKQWLIGAGITYSTFMNQPGVNLNITYQPIGNLHIGPDFSALLTREQRENGSLVKRKELEYNFNTTYLFFLKDKFAIYPVAGVNFSKIAVHKEGEAIEKKWFTGINAGAGLEYELNKYRIFLEVKYVTSIVKYDTSLGLIIEL